MEAPVCFVPTATFCFPQRHIFTCNVQALCANVRISSFVLWSLSFYPQPLLNWKRKNTQGLTIDYPTLNVLGFFAYTVSTACFLWSPTVREQYAYNHPLSPEPTVRGNDFAFAFHAVILCIITYSQFYPRLWGFKTSRRQQSSPLVLGIFWGNVLAVLILICIVWVKGNGGMDTKGWSWIDVVSLTLCSIPLTPQFLMVATDLRLLIRQVDLYFCEVHPSSVDQL